MKPKKYLGQNFLTNIDIASKIVSAAQIKPTDTILEIGSGTGILTDELVKTKTSILTIEKDYNLITKLQKRYLSLHGRTMTGKNTKNLKIIHQDALWFNLDNIERGYKVVANIPYNITSPLIRKFLESPNKPKLIILMVQKEVAERITAKPGDSNRGLLTLIVEFYGQAEILFEISKKEFYPIPKVDSAVIKIEPNHHLRGDRKQVKPEIFFKIVKAGFSAKRRQIHNSLAATLHWSKEETKAILDKAKIASTLRAEDLTMRQWLNLYQLF